MATVVKNFRIKSGLIVEGASGTIGGHNILTESTSGDQYILNLVGGATLVKSVGANLSVDNAGELSLDLTGIVEDIAGTRLYTDGSTINVDVEGIYDDMIVNGIATVTNVNNAIDTAATDATNKANAALSDAQSYATTAANNAQSAAEATAATDATNKANAAQSAAESFATTAANNAQSAAEDYADNLINDGSSASTEVWSAYKTSTEIGLAQAAAEQHADDAVAALVGSAPAVLDTIQELATALENNPDIIADLENVAAGKQNTLTAGTGITLSNDEISVTVNTYDAYGAALDAQNAAALDATSKADDAQAAAATYTDNQITNLTTGGNGFTSLNIDDVVAQRAVLSEGLPAMLNEVFNWSASDFRSAKVLVKVANGVHTQISELMVTLDTSNNVAVSEYGITYSNGTELAAITADYLSGNVRVLATPANAGADVMVLATLI